MNQVFHACLHEFDFFTVHVKFTCQSTKDKLIFFALYIQYAEDNANIRGYVQNSYNTTRFENVFSYHEISHTSQMAAIANDGIHKVSGKTKVFYSN